MVESEIIQFALDQGTPGLFPSFQMLWQARRSDLGRAIRIFGGANTVARRMGWEKHRYKRHSGRNSR